MAHTHFMPAESCLLFSKAQHITPCLRRFLQAGWAVGNAHQPEESSCSVNASFLCFLSSPHYHLLPCCHFYDKLEFLVLGERNLTNWSQFGTAGITADHGLSHLLQQEWKHPSEKGPTSVTGDAWQATTAAHWDPVTTNSGAHGSWGSQDRKIPLWEHITHPS